MTRNHSTTTEDQKQHTIKEVKHSSALKKIGNLPKTVGFEHFFRR